MLAIESPLPLFVGRDGLPLDAGYIYFGTVNLNPVTSPVTVYWDAAGYAASCAACAHVTRLDCAQRNALLRCTRLAISRCL